MLFGHWFPPHDTSLAGCNSDIVTVGYSFWLFVLFVCLLFFFFPNDSFLTDLRF